MFTIRACYRRSPFPQRHSDAVPDKSKPVVRLGRKATGLFEIAGLPKQNILSQHIQYSFATLANDACGVRENPMSQSNILVVDDSRTIRTLVRRVLLKAGYSVTVASNGHEAIRLAQEQTPRLVILDICMPDMDGYATCQELLTMRDSWDELPIVFLTKEQAQHMDTLGHELGAYLRKPVDDERLISTVQSLLAHQNQLQ